MSQTRRQMRRDDPTKQTLDVSIAGISMLCLTPRGWQRRQRKILGRRGAARRDRRGLAEQRRRCVLLLSGQRALLTADGNATSGSSRGHVLWLMRGSGGEADSGTLLLSLLLLLLLPSRARDLCRASHSHFADLVRDTCRFHMRTLEQSGDAVSPLEVEHDAMSAAVRPRLAKSGSQRAGRDRTAAVELGCHLHDNKPHRKRAGTQVAERMSAQSRAHRRRERLHWFSLPCRLLT